MSGAVLRMVDLSSNNGTPDLAKHYAAGYRIIALKATESTTYNWPGDDALTARWHALGGKVVHYHFARPGSARAQADYFLSAVAGRWADGDLLCLDAEVDGVNGAFAQAFINRCHAKRPNAGGLVYGPPYFLRDHGIKPAHGWGLWIADYEGKVDFIPPGWERWTARQFTDKATGIPGIPGAVDHSRIRREFLPLAPPPPLTDKHRAALVVATKVLNGRKKPLADADRKTVAALDAAALAALKK